MQKNNAFKILLLIILMSLMSGCIYYPATDTDINDPNDTTDLPGTDIPGEEEIPDADVVLLQEEISRLNLALSELEAENASLENQAATLQAQVDTHSALITQYDADIKQYDLQIKSLESDATTRDERIAELEGEKAALVQSVADLNARIKTLEASITTLTAQQASLNDTIDSLTSQKALLESENQALEAQIDAIYQRMLLATTETIKANLMVKEFNYDSRGRLYSISQGSGVIIKEDSFNYYALTNHHVIYGDPAYPTHTYKVYDYKMNEYTATVMYKSPDYDLALVSFPKNSGITLKVLVLAAADPALGEEVIAFGQPEGQINAITFGDVIRYQNPNVVDNPLQSNVLFPCILHDAYINHGNSGGMLVNANMEIVGINTFGTESLSYGFAVPVLKIREYLQAVGFTIA